MNILVRERFGTLNMSSLAKKRSKLRRKNNRDREREHERYEGNRHPNEDKKLQWI